MGRVQTFRLMHRSNCYLFSKWLSDCGRNEKWSSPEPPSESSELGQNKLFALEYLVPQWLDEHMHRLWSILWHICCSDNRAMVWWTCLALLGCQRTWLPAMVLLRQCILRLTRLLTGMNINRTAGDASLISE